MKWRGRRGSSNVKDYRGRSRAAGPGGAGIAMLLNAVGRRFGMKGIIAVIVVGALRIGFSRVGQIGSAG